jgi:uncharacterized SAM-binding protein YcdF (DUF218 family)
MESPERTPLESSGKTRPRRIGGRIFLAVLGAYVIGFFVFVASLPAATPPETASKSARADGIVALTGGSERLDAATALFESGVGRRLLITGVHPTTTKLALKTLVHGGHRFDCCADLGFQATNTHGNAAEAAQWAKSHGYKSLIVVTAAYHMPRSLIEFSAQMPREKLIPYPVASENIDVHGWWHPVALAVLQWEYTKYLGSVALNALFPPHPESARQTSGRHRDSV